MSDYTPDRWVAIKIVTTNEVLYKIFASWYGGYLGSDSWNLNRGITTVRDMENSYAFDGSSGSVYECHKNAYGYNRYGGSVLHNMIDKAKENGVTIEILPENTNWLEINYE
jgi:hypothetical protein